MEIYACNFRINHPDGAGHIHGVYRDGEVHFSGTSSYPTENNRWSGSSYHQKEDQEIYLDLLQDAIELKRKLFIGGKYKEETPR